MISPRSSSAKEEKENEVFFKKVKLLLVTCPHQSSLKRDVFCAKRSSAMTSAVDLDSFNVKAGGLIQLFHCSLTGDRELVTMMN